MTTQRTDTHRPAEFDPADYVVIDDLDMKQPDYYPGLPIEAYEAQVRIWRERILQHFPDWTTGGTDHTSIFQCNHCGHHGLRWVAVVLHKPTGRKLAFGDICADRCDLDGRDEFRRKFIKDRAALEAAALENKVRRAKFAEDNADVIEFLETVENSEAAYRDEMDAYDRSFDLINNRYTGRRPKAPATSHPFLTDMVHALNRNNELTENQVNATRKFMARHEEFAARRAVEEAEAENAGTFPEGRVQVEGEVVSIKFQESEYGTTMKMLVKTDDGNKLWGTVPSSIESREADGGYVALAKGDRVRFTGTFTVSDDDEHFGFFKRPAKAEVLTAVAA